LVSWAPTANNAWLNQFRPLLEQRHRAILGFLFDPFVCSLE
jgi:hypothetical protein